jgi:branched-chain amino acid transport system substrate-binding protein
LADNVLDGFSKCYTGGKTMRKVLMVSLTVLMFLALLGTSVACQKAAVTTQPESTQVGQAEPIKIGVFGAMQYLQGEHSWYGAEIAAEEINKDGGVLVGNVRRPIELVKIDTNELISIPDAVTAIERAISVDKVDFLTGGFRTEACLAMEEVAAQNKKIFIVPPCGHPDVLKKVASDYDHYKYIFRVSLSVLDTIAGTQPIVTEVVNKIKQELNIQTVKTAELAEKVVWPDPLLQAWKDMAPSTGMEIVGEWRPSSTSTDVKPELTAIKDAGAQLILTALGGPMDVITGKQYGALGIPAVQTGFSAEGSQIGYWNDTEGNCNYMSSFAAFADIPMTSKTIPVWNRFLELSNGESPTQSAYTYDAVWALKHAIEAAGTLDSDAVVSELEKVKFEGFTGTVAFSGPDAVFPNEFHDQIYGPGYMQGVGVQWQDGELKVFWPENMANTEFELPPRVIEYWKK